MTCYDESALRSWLDDQPCLVAGTTSADISDHVAHCVDCQLVTADLHARASAAANAIALLSPSALQASDIEQALTAVRRPAGPVTPVTVLVPRRRRWAKPVSAAAAAAVILAVAGTPAGRSSASSFLEQFRSTRIAVVELSPGDRDALAELAQLGTVSGRLDAFNPEYVESASAASKAVGIPVLSPDPSTLPPGVNRDPEIRFSRAQELRFTLDRRQALDWLATKNSTIDVPARFDGASIVVDVPAVVLQNFAAPDGTPGVIIGQARQIVARAEGGVTLDELRAFLLSLPGLSADTKRQLENIDDWRDTLPLPLPAGDVEWKETTIAGTDGLLLGDNTGLGAAGIWQRDGFIYGVAVRGKANQVRSVAAGLR